MSKAHHERRPLTIRVRATTTQPDDYLGMLDIALTRTHDHRTEQWFQRFQNAENFAQKTTRSKRPKMLVANDPQILIPADPKLFGDRYRDPSKSHDHDHDREWKLSARLDRELLAELYGAADQLVTHRASVSSMVEEALRLYLPRLRDRHNSGHPFPQRGPKTRSKTRSAMLKATSV